MFFGSKDITLVLGGIGIKGVANFGVLRAFREHNVPVRKIITTGLSSVAALQHSSGMEPFSLVNSITRFFIRHERKLWGLGKIGGVEEGIATREFSYFLRARLFCRSNIRRMSILTWDKLDPILKDHFANIEKTSLDVTIAVSAIDLDNDRVMLLEKENLIERLKVGLSFPGILPPVEINGKRYINSSLYCELPLGTVSENDRPVVAVDIPSRVEQPIIRSLIDVMSYADEARSCAIKEIMLQKADHVITLNSLRNFHWGNFIQTPRLAQQAYRETSELLGKINMEQ